MPQSSPARNSSATQNAGGNAGGTPSDARIDLDLLPGEQPGMLSAEAEARADAERFADPVERSKHQIERGLQRCRNGDWELGVRDLMIASQSPLRRDLPSLVYSYLGYALARTEGDTRRGIRFCRRALKIEFYQPENYLNLARIEMMEGNRRAAYRAVCRGLDFDPQHEELLELRGELGDRLPPVLPFLSRGHFFNRLLGRLRHDVKGNGKPSVSGPPNEMSQGPGKAGRPAAKKTVAKGARSQGAPRRPTTGRAAAPPPGKAKPKASARRVPGS